MDGWPVPADQGVEEAILVGGAGQLPGESQLPGGGGAGEEQGPPAGGETGRVPDLGRLGLH
ncbi:hypothetical protein CGZ91_12950 [Parenemella sanctibonifatiensis]|uniref:Uncharacterized protein n=1 Tax=Parenemella sanctibonifatiensis TaxID=2016505 RepID=A0A255EC90_9ACTN|nr:hypothetical protein CGZ91_12950 [Parenemella sanctibonifatiensis]